MPCGSKGSSGVEPVGPFSLEATIVTKETYLKPREAAEYLKFLDIDVGKGPHV